MRFNCLGAAFAVLLAASPPLSLSQAIEALNPQTFEGGQRSTEPFYDFVTEHTSTVLIHNSSDHAFSRVANRRKTGRDLDPISISLLVDINYSLEVASPADRSQYPRMCMFCLCRKIVRSTAVASETHCRPLSLSL